MTCRMTGMSVFPDMSIQDYNLWSDSPGSGLVRVQKPEDVSDDQETFVKQRIVEAASIAPPAVAQLFMFFFFISVS